jgi:NADPH:quinone reductase-like Zn-dependent oxidoreductase
LADLVGDHASIMTQPAVSGLAIVGKPPANEAVWLVAKRGRLEIKPAPYTPPRENEIVVRNHAVAINPIDWLTQSMGDIFFPWLKYPFILGSDVAGEVVEVGAAVSRFRVGDRILGHAVGVDKKRNNPAEGAFQEYTVLLSHMAAPIPDAMPYENAAVLPLTLSTAACGLFEKDQLGLHHPSAQPKPTGKTLLVWGGSTSLGSNAIQLAVAAGYEVITTASPKNFGYVRQLGATEAFDYKSKTVVSDVIKAFNGRTLAGALAIGVGSAGACLDIVHACEGNKFVSMATPPVSFDQAPDGSRRTLWLVPTMARLISSNVLLMIKARLRGIRTKFIFGSSLMANEVGPMIYADFLPKALADGRYVAAPDPMVIGRGLDQVQAGLIVQKKGVSAKKVVVSL